MHHQCRLATSFAAQLMLSCSNIADEQPRIGGLAVSFSLIIECTSEGSSLHLRSLPLCRGSHKHCVVGRLSGAAAEPEAVHDPHPDGTMLGGTPEWAGFLLAI